MSANREGNCTHNFEKLLMNSKVFGIKRYIVYRTQGAEGSQPAMKARRNEDMKKIYRIKDVNVCMNVRYNICECYHRVL
jgi:hypothetical protein